MIYRTAHFAGERNVCDAKRARHAKRSPHSENLLQKTCQFLAQRYLPQNEWELFSKTQERAAKHNTEKT